jgi:hypothetical protein
LYGRLDASAFLLEECGPARIVRDHVYGFDRHLYGDSSTALNPYTHPGEGLVNPSNGRHPKSEYRTYKVFVMRGKV